MTFAPFTIPAEHLPEPVLVLARDGRILAANRAAVEDFGLTAPPPALADLVADPAQHVAKHLKQWFSSGSLRPGMLTFRTPRGEIPYRCDGCRHLDQDGCASIYIRCRPREIAGQSFTALNEMIEQLRQEVTVRRRTEATLNAVLDALPVGLVIVDAQGGVVRDNAAHHALWGVPPETTSWEQYGEWVGYWPQTGERIKVDGWAMARALLKGETVKGELVECERFGTGERRFFLNNSAPVRDQAGCVIAGVVAELDVTEAKLAERALRESEARLKELQMELLHVARLSDMGQIASALAHELSQPLTAATASACIT